MENFHPVPVLLLGAVQMALVASTLAYAPKLSALRLVTLALLGPLGYYWYWSSSGLCTSGLWNGTCAAMTVVYCLHHVDLLLIKKVDRADLVDTSKPGQDGGFFRALYLSLSTRGISSRWQISSVPAFSSYYRSRKDPDRLSYLFRTMIIFTWQYLILDLLDSQMAGQSVEEQQELYGNDQEFVLFTATKKQLGTRALMSLGASFLVARLVMDFVYRAVSLVAVGTGISKPKDWPPFFGTMKDTHSLRDFWGKFWHQWFRGPLSAASTFTVRSILGLPKRSMLERYTAIFVTFTMSGVIHILNDIVAGKGVQIGTMMTFQSFAIGIALENTVQALSRRFSGGEGSTKSKRQTPTWQRWIGYVWVQIFHFIVTPWYLYPSGRMPAGSMWVVPYSVVGVIGVPGAGVAIVICSLVTVAFLKPEV